MGLGLEAEAGNVRVRSGVVWQTWLDVPRSGNAWHGRHGSMRLDPAMHGMASQARQREVPRGLAGICSVMARQAG